jgi:WD40 repeat protein
MTKGWRHRGRMLVLSHFTSASLAARSPTRMLERFCRRMSDHFFLDDPYVQPADYPALCRRFVSYIDRCSTSFRGDALLLVVDSLEELELWQRHQRGFVSEEVSPVEWVPERFRVKPFFAVRLILALDPAHAPTHVARLRTRLHSLQVNEIIIEPLRESVRAHVLSELIARSRSTPAELLPGLVEECSPIAAFSASAQPLFLSLAATQLSALPSDTPIPTIGMEIARLPTNLSDLAVATVQRIEQDCDGRSGYMREIIQLLCCARRGLLEEEIWELVKLRCAVDRSRPKLYRLLAVLQHMGPLVQSRPAWDDHGGEQALQLSHSFLRRILVARYLRNAQVEEATHKRLADLFYQAFLRLNLERIGGGTDAWLYKRIITDRDARGLSEVMVHATRAHMEDEVVELACSLRVVELRLMFDNLAEMLEDYREAIEMLAYAGSSRLHQVSEFCAFLQTNSNDLLSRPSNTFQLAANSPIQTAPAIVSRAMLRSFTEKRLWLEYRNKRQDQALGSDFNLGGEVLDITFTPDSRFITAVSDKRTTHIFDSFSGVEVHSVTDFSHTPTCACLVPVGDVLITASDLGVVSFWDVASGERDLAFPLHSKEAQRGLQDRLRVNRVKCAHDSRCLILALENHKVVLLDAHSNDPRVHAVLRGHTGPVRDCDVSRDNKYAVSASDDRTLRVWDLDTYSCVQQCVGHYDAVLACSFGGSGHAVFSSASRDASVRTWQTSTGVVISVYSGHVGCVYGCAMGVIGPQVITAGDDATVRVWDSSDGSQLDQWGRMTPMQLQYAEGHVGPTRRVLLSHDCLRAVSSGADGHVKVWKLKGGHEKQINWVAFTPDKTRVVTCSVDKSVRSFEVLTATEMTKSVGHVGPVRRVAISPGESSWKLYGLARRARNQSTDTCVIATAADDCHANVINVNTGMTLAHLRGHERGVNHVEFSPEGDLVATASADATVKIWDAVTGKLKCTLTGHTSEIAAIMFTKDQKSLLSVSHDTSARVWDIEGGFLLALLSGHTMPVTCVDYSPKSNRAVTGSKDKTLRLWNMWKAAQTKTLRGHTAGILACAFSKNGTRIFSGGRDKTIRVWGVDESDPANKGWTPQKGYAPMQQLTSFRRKVAYPGAKATVLTASPSDMHVAVGYEDGVITRPKSLLARIRYHCSHASQLWSAQAVELIRQVNLAVDQSWQPHTADVTVIPGLWRHLGNCGMAQLTGMCNMVGRAWISLRMAQSFAHVAGIDPFTCTASHTFLIRHGHSSWIRKWRARHLQLSCSTNSNCGRSRSSGSMSACSIIVTARS